MPFFEILPRRSSRYSTRARGEESSTNVEGGPSMKKLPIYKSGEVVGHALLDDRDFLAVCEWNWHLTHQGYAYREFRIEGKRHKVFLHRFILVLTSDDKIQVDHKNRNRLDCQRSNL